MTTPKTIHVFLIFVVTMWVSTSSAQSVNKSPTDNQNPERDRQELLERIEAMQSKISDLEAALDSSTSPKRVTDDANPGVESSKPSSQKMKEMGRSGDEKRMGKGKGKGMGDGATKGMREKNSSPGKKMGMEMMGRGKRMMGKVKGMGGMDTPSSLPGFPGASHIYHIGADGFFLDHSDHIELSRDQQSALNELKENSLLQQAEFDRKVEAAEQELWVLTSSDSPDAEKIENKIFEIAKFQSSQRIAFIQAVGASAKILREEQRKVLTGMTDN